MKLGILVLRLVVGGAFVGHGLQKLTGAFGGGGLERTGQVMESIGMSPGPRNARAAALTETVGGAAIALGLFTPVAAAGLIGTMVTAIRKVHLSKGVWNSGGGYEYNAVLIAALAAIATDGPGLVSIDAARGRKVGGIVAGLFAIGAGIVGSTALIELGKRASTSSATEA